MKHRSLFLFATLVCTSFVFAQPSPGVGNAVLLATNSIEIDRDSAVLSGDIIVNNAASGPVLHEKALSLDRNTSTPAGYKLAATSILLHAGVVVVAGRADFGASSIVAPADGSGLTSAAIRLQVDGLNGSDGALLSTPPAIHVGQAGKVFATLYATAGSLIMEQDVEGNGAFLGRDILVAHGGHLTLNSAFNQPPTAHSQTVFTNGSAPLQITLTGSDPEGGALTFSIVSGPSAGTLSAPVSASATSATVTYTPAAASVADSFTFRVSDRAGATGDAVVRINPTADPTPPDPTTVIATDSSVQTTKDVAATLLLRGTAPAGVSLTFSVVSNTRPSHGPLR